MLKEVQGEKTTAVPRSWEAVREVTFTSETPDPDLMRKEMVMKELEAGVRTPKPPPPPLGE